MNDKKIDVIENDIICSGCGKVIYEDDEIEINYNKMYHIDCFEKMKNNKKYEEIGICDDCENPIYKGDKTVNTQNKMYHEDCFSNNNIHNEVRKKEKFEKEIKELVDEIVNILIKKNKGYGNSFYNGLNNIKKSLDYDDDRFKNMHYFPFYARELDKLSRINSLITSSIPKKDKEDAIYDAVLDLAGYAILFLNYIKNYDK